MNLDFSQFHPLDHWPGSKRCRSLPGGTRNHLSLTWEFRRRDQVVGPVRRLVMCPLGRHEVQVWYVHDVPGGPATRIRPICKHCPYTRLPSEAEIHHKRLGPFA